MQHCYRQSIRILTVLMVFWLLIGSVGTHIHGAPAAAKGAQAQQSSLIDAVLVVDVSNSMKTSDTNKVGNEAMKMFIDMLSA